MDTVQARETNYSRFVGVREITLSGHGDENAAWKEGAAVRDGIERVVW